MNDENQKREQKPGDQPSKKESEGKPKLSETFEHLKKNEKVESFLEYARTNTQDTIAYALMIIGLIWFLIHGFSGGILIGLVAGFYFSRELTELLKSYNEFIEAQGIPRSLILGGTLVALFIAAPGVFVGAAIMVGLKIMLRAD